MQATLGVPEALAGSLGAFVQAESIPLGVVTGDKVTVRVVQGQAGQESSVSMLQAGGWIACLTAHQMAERLGVETRQVGKLLDHLEIKIKTCELGCF
jgi:2-keto-4-pentenoate hydratase